MFSNLNILMTAQQPASIWTTLLTMFPLLLIFGIFYFLTIRPQRKREKELKAQVNTLEVGDEIVSIGGIVGKVMNVSGDELTIATSVANTMITLKKSAVGTVIKKSDKNNTEVEPKKKKLFGKSEE